MAQEVRAAVKKVSVILQLSRNFRSDLDRYVGVLVYRSSGHAFGAVLLSTATLPSLLLF